MTTSMTKGNPTKLMLRFALPLLLGNLFQQLYNMVDAIIVGRRLGSLAFAGVGATSSVQFLVIGGCVGVCAGFGIPVAQRFGAEDYGEMRRYIFHAAILTAILAAAAAGLTTVFTHNILHFLNTPEDIYADAYTYIFILFAGIPFTLLYNLLAAILRAVGDSRTPFIFLIISSFLNIGLDLLFIIVLKAGVAGAALATIMSQAVSGVCCLVLIRQKYDVLRITRNDTKLDSKHFKTLLVMGLPMGLQYSITAIGSMVLQSANNGLGSLYVSAFTAGMKIKQLAMCPFDAIANAVATFASQNLGAGNGDRIKQGVRQGVIIGVSYGLAIGAVLFFFGRSMSLMFVDASETEVLDTAGMYLRRLGLFYWTLGILNVMRMTTQGLGFSGRTIFSGVFEMVARVVVGVLLVPKFGFDAVTFADQLAWLSGCVYIAPTCIHCISLSIRRLAVNSNE